MEVLREIDIDGAHITVYRDKQGRIILGGWGWIEFYDYERGT